MHLHPKKPHNLQGMRSNLFLASIRPVLRLLFRGCQQRFPVHHPDRSFLYSVPPDSAAQPHLQMPSSGHSTCLCRASRPLPRLPAKHLLPHNTSQPAFHGSLNKLHCPSNSGIPYSWPSGKHPHTDYPSLSGMPSADSQTEYGPKVHILRFPGCSASIDISYLERLH